MKNVNLWVGCEGWKSFDLTTEEGNAAIKVRHISIGEGSSIGDGCRLAERSSIGDFSNIGDGSSIGERSSIGRGSRLGDGSSIGYGSSIGKGSTIGDDSTIGNLTSIGDDSNIGYGSTIGSRSTIGDCSIIGDYSSIEDCSTIGNASTIGDNSSLGFRSTIGDNVKVKSLFIQGSNHGVMYWGEDKIQIGCQQDTLQGWQNNYKEAGHVQGYTPEEIAEYGSYIAMVVEFHKTAALPIVTNQLTNQ